MGITLVSPAAVANACTTATPASVDSALPVDFAALLGQQISGVAQLLGASPVTGTSPPTGDRKAEDPEQPVATTADPSLIPFIVAGIEAPPLRPAGTAAGTRQGDDAADHRTSAPNGLPAGSLPDLKSSAQSAPPLATTTGRSELTGGSPALPITAQEDKAAGATANFAGNLPGDDKAAGFAATLAAQHRPGEVAQAAADKPVARLATPVSEPGWGQDLGNRIVWMANNDQQTAHLNLTPPQLGPLQVTINVNGDQATAVFTSPHAEVRQAIEDALPRLREMLTASGINLGQADVGAQTQQQNNAHLPQSPANPRTTGDKAILQGIGAAGTANSAPALTQRGRGLVDLFA